MKIAFGYQMGCGKDTAVGYLIEKYGGYKLSFASPLYDILNYTQTVCKFPTEKDRYFLQTIGTWAREKDRDVWVKLLIEKSKEYKPTDNLFIADLRFKNEMEELKKEGWILVKINRKNNDVITRAGSGDSNHESELELKNVKDFEWDFIIENDKRVEDLFNSLDKLIKFF
jgi:hypothetical protein